MSIDARPIRLSPLGKLITVAVIVALALLLIRGLGNVIIPFVAAAITAYLFNPLITYLHRRTHIARAIWIGVLYVVGGFLVYGLFRYLGPLVRAQYAELSVIIPWQIAQFSQQIEGTRTIEIFGMPIDISSVRGQIVDGINAAMATIGRQIPEYVPHLVATAFETLLLFVTYLMITYYLLLEADRIMEWFYGLVPAPYRDEIRWLGRQIDGILAGYIRGTLLLIPIMAVLTYIALTILGVRYALVIGIISGIVETIPLLGPWSAALLAITVATFQETTPFGWPHWLLAGVIGLTYFVLRMFEDNFIIPNVVGPAVHLHPMLVIFAILAGGALGGPFGLFVSIPVAAVLRLLLSYFYHKLIDDPNYPPREQPPAAADPATSDAESQSVLPAPEPATAMGAQAE
jgi:predicted PurR-regulated permease PerM